MGFLSRAFGRDAVELASAARKPLVFSTDIDSGVLYGTPTLDDYIRGFGKVTKREALRVPAVVAAIESIAAAIGQFDLKVYGPDGKEATTFQPNLFQQPEAGIAPSNTWTNVVSDLMLFERAWLKVTETGWHGRVVTVERLEGETVTVQPDFVTYPYGQSLRWPDIPGLIRIDSPKHGLLSSSPAIRACIALERATAKAAGGIPPMVVVTPKEDTDPLDDPDEIQEQIIDPLSGEGLIKYLGSALDIEAVGWNPAQMDLTALRNQAVLEIARLTGLDPSELGVPVTTHTYFNATDKRRSRVHDVLGPFMEAIEGRLSMDDVTPHGYTVRFDTSGYLSMDDLEAAQADAALIAAHVIVPNEARDKRGLEPIDGGDEFHDVPAPNVAAKENANA